MLLNNPEVDEFIFDYIIPNSKLKVNDGQPFSANCHERKDNEDILQTFLSFHPKQKYRLKLFGSLLDNDIFVMDMIWY